MNLKAIIEMAQKIELGAYDKMEGSLNDLCNYVGDSVRVGKRFGFSCLTTFVFLLHKVIMSKYVIDKTYLIIHCS